MTSLSSQSTLLNKQLRRTVRAWWADGLWDMAVAGFCGLTAVWLFPLVRVLAFPAWTWPWPFVTEETVNPMRQEIALWALGMLAVWALFSFVAYWVVSWLKRRFVATRLGDVRFKFILPIENRILPIFIASYLLISFLVMGLFWLTTGGPRISSAFCVVAPAAMLFTIGKIYELPRYQWVAVLGVALAIGAEFFTTTAVYLEGPTNFLDVSATVGNPSLPLLVWAGVFLLSGLLAFYQTMRLPHVTE